MDLKSIKCGFESHPSHFLLDKQKSCGIIRTGCESVMQITLVIIFAVAGIFSFVADWKGWFGKSPDRADWRKWVEGIEDE